MILNKEIIHAYAKAIRELKNKDGNTVEIRETLSYLSHNWTDETVDGYAKIGVLIDLLEKLALKYEAENKVIDKTCGEFWFNLLDLELTSK